VSAVIRDKARQRLGREQGHVAGDDQHIPSKAGKLRLGRADRVPGAALLFLESKDHPVCLTRRLNRGGLMADHDNQAAGVEALAGLNDPRQERLSGQMMQHLGLPGAHARPLARSQNDNAQGLRLVLIRFSHVNPSSRPFPQSDKRPA